MRRAEVPVLVKENFTTVAKGTALYFIDSETYLKLLGKVYSTMELLFLRHSQPTEEHLQYKLQLQEGISYQHTSSIDLSRRDRNKSNYTFSFIFGILLK